MKILLIVPPHPFTLPRIPALGLAWLAGYLRERAEHQIHILDFIRDSGRGYDSYIDEILSHEADVVGFTLFSRDIPMVSRMTETIKNRRPETMLIVGGAHVSAAPEHTLKIMPRVDFGIRGEGEIGFYQVIEEMESGTKRFSSIPGLIWREGQEIKANDQRYEMDLDSLGFPAWDMIDPNLYAEKHQPHGVVSRERLTAPIFATRGCPYQCTYCGAHLVTGYRIRRRSVKHVVEEMEMINKEFGVREFHIEDDNFTLDVKYTTAFCEEVLRRGHNWEFACPNGVRLNSLNPELIRLMDRTGFYSFAVGIETATPRLLKYLKRGVSKEKMREKLNMIAENSDIDVVGYAFLGIPTETEEEMENTVRFLLEVPLARIGLGWLNAFPRDRDV